MGAQRGSAVLRIDGYDDIELCMTLGVLEAIEEKYGVDNIQEIGEIFKNPTASKVLFLIHAMHQGAGGTKTREELGRLPLDLRAMTDALSDAVQAAFPKKEGESSSGE